MSVQNEQDDKKPKPKPEEVTYELRPVRHTWTDVELENIIAQGSRIEKDSRWGNITSADIAREIAKVARFSEVCS